MTTEATGLQHIEIQRAKDDRRYTGRTLRLIPDDGGQIVLHLSASSLRWLQLELQVAMQSLVRTSSGWCNVDEGKQDG